VIRATPLQVTDQSRNDEAENLAAAVSLHFLHYNFARPHKTLSEPYPTTPAMAAGAADHVWTLREIAGLLN
jgi:hypothetical protein